MIVAFLGVTMRYKIAFSLPFIDQKHILHAHSHFAFTGWLTQVLMACMVYYLSFQNPDAFRRYRCILTCNLISSYGMLLSFPFEGYGVISIIFSTLSIFVSYWFAVKYWKDLNKLPAKTTTHLWFKAANLFAALSSLGAFSLGYMMATRTVHQNWYLAATYFFLHFQYNGWFLFACAGLFNWLMVRQQIRINAANNIFWLFALACVPAFFLSALWLPISAPVYVMVVAAACLQMAGWILFLVQMKPQLRHLAKTIPSVSKWLLGLSSVALTIKLLLQLGSTIPSLSVLAFGFRPVVIGYLHLVLLAVISLFVIGCLAYFKILAINKTLITGVIIFVTGVFLNELALMIQGTAAMAYNSIPYTNELLFGVALIMFTGIVIINYSQLNKKSLVKNWA